MSGTKSISSPWYSVFGLGPTPDATIYGNRLEHYPGKDDVAAAQRSGFGYGTGNEAYMAGNASNQWSMPAKGRSGARAISVDDVTDPTKSATDPALRNAMPGNPDLAQIYAAAQLAALRSPITGLGYDPHKIALDTKSGSEVTVAGMYSGKTDSIYSNAGYLGNILHESTHRGLNMLREAGLIPESLQKRLPKEEDVVRYIMALHMGDPEKERGDDGKEQRASGLLKFGHDPKDPQADKNVYERSVTRDHRIALNELNDIAARYIAARTPMGPR